MFDILSSFYKNKKVFVTGHTGFKGSWLVYWLHSLGAIVKGYSLEPENEENLFKLYGQEACISIIGDILNGEKLANEIISFGPDLIFHLAAQPLVRLSYEIPLETFNVNVIGTANVLEAVKSLDNKCAIILITTDKVYYNFEWEYPYRETDRLGGYDPYSASKACVELIIGSYRNSFFNTKNYSFHQKAIAVARAGNVVGGGDYSRDRIIPDIIRSLSLNKAIEVRNPKSIRPWQHVLEPLSGYLLLGSSLYENPLKFSKEYNFGPLQHDYMCVKEVVEVAIKNWGSGDWVDKSSPNECHEAGVLKLDISRALNELKWKPRLNTEKAIEWTMEWYKRNSDERYLFTLNQIKKYQNL